MIAVVREERSFVERGSSETLSGGRDGAVKTSIGRARRDFGEIAAKGAASSSRLVLLSGPSRTRRYLWHGGRHFAGYLSCTICSRDVSEVFVVL